MIKENVIIKKDTGENWAKAINFVPKENEIIMYTEGAMKIGDGKTKLNDLPFVDQNHYAIDGNTFIIETKGE